MKNLFTLLIGTICVGLTTLPLFHKGFFVPHDFTHAARIAEMNRSLIRGEFPVRWSENFGFGYGMPLFNFYAPLPYYAAQIPYAITHDAIFAIKFLYVVNAILAFAGMYLFGMALWGMQGGIISGVSFSFSTYRALDLYVRGALGEVSAMVLLPFALYGIHRLRSHKKQGILIIAFSLSSILLSHNLIGMISIGVLVLYGCLSLGWKKTMPILGSVLLAFSLSAFYVLPAYFEKDFTRVDSTITIGYFDYHKHFVALRQFIFGEWGYGGSQPGLEDGMSFALGYMPMILLIGSAIGIFLTQKKLRKFITLCVLLGGSLFMASSKSVFLWEQIETLKYMQFPWRFLTFSHVFLSAAVGGISVVLQKRVNFNTGTLLIGGILLLFPIFNVSFFSPLEFISNTQEFYSTDPLFIRKTMSKTLNDYMPSEQLENPSSPLSRSRLADSASSQVDVLSLQDKGSVVAATVHCDAYCLADVNIFQFPGWQARVDGKLENLVKYNAFHIYGLRIPPGNHNVTLQLTDTPIRRFGNALSMVSLIGILSLMGFPYVKRAITKSP